MPSPPPPRLLVRRALAALLDHTIALVLVTVAFLPFADLGLRLPQPMGQLRTVACTDLEAAPDWLLADLTDPRFGVLRVCENTLWGRPNGQELIAAYSDIQPDGTRITALTRTPVDRSLMPTGIPDLSAAAVLALMGLIAALLGSRGWLSPGKAALRLRVTGAHHWRREALRLGPLVALTALPAFVPVEPLTWPFGAILGGSALMALGLTWYYLWPFAHWTGQSRHDRLSGTKVIAAKSAPVPPPAVR